MIKFEHLDLNLLRTFDTIFSERSLTGAARVLNISQPAVSNALQRLRESLDDPLFVRERRGMVPTTFAESIAPTVHRALTSIKQELSLQDEFVPDRTARVFRLSMNDIAEALFLHDLTMRCLEIAPNVDLQCRFVSPQDIANEMARGTLDIAIDVQIAADDRLHQANLIEESYACLVRPGHPLARSAIMMEDYLGLGHVHVTARRHGSGHIDQILQADDLARHIKVRLRSPAIAAGIVHSTDLAITLPERFALYHSLAAIPLPFHVPRLNWRLYWPARQDTDSGNRWLREQIVEIATEAKNTVGRRG